MKESQYNTWVERGDASYVYNGLSGALLRVPKEDYKLLRLFLDDQSRTDCSAKLLFNLAQGRMLVPDDCSELEILQSRYKESQADTTRFSLTLVSSLGCNFDCPYCFEAKYSSVMDESVKEAIVQVVDDQLPKIKSFFVTWFGGEPLVGKKVILDLSDRFIERCERAGVEYSADIVTNGFLLNEQTCIQLHERRVTFAQIGLDGPPTTHNRMRPQANGKGSFWEIVRNLHHAVKYFDVAIRMNVDTVNIESAEELFKILESEGLSGKIGVYPGQLVGVNDGAPSPSSTYKPRCFTTSEFAKAELQFVELASRYGFSKPKVPTPSGAPCTAVRVNELVVGSKGELYKCWDSVGNQLEVTGNIRDYLNPNGRMQKWLKYDPFTNDECRSCIALPGCMGGCAHHAMDANLYENRCGTFRFAHNEQVKAFIEFAEQKKAAGLLNVDQIKQNPVQIARRMETR